MRIFVLGVGATGSLLAQLLVRQGHTVVCGDRDPERARHFLGRRSPIEIRLVNARNLWGIVREARGSQLIVNASSAVFNEIVLRAALRLRAHYLDMSTHMTRNPFKAEQLRYAHKFEQKRRVAVINAGVAPGLTNLLAQRAAEMLDHVEQIHIRLYQSTESDDPVSQWSATGSFDEAISRPRIVRAGKFELARRFSEREKFRFAQPIGETSVILAAQDEVSTLPYFIPLKEMDVKIGGNEMDRLRRWYRQGKLSKSGGIVHKRFPKTLTPRRVAKLIKGGALQNARFAAAVLVTGTKRDEPMLIRWDCQFPSLYQIRLWGLAVTPISYATATLASLFVRHFPKDESGVFPPEALPIETRQAILAGVRARGFRISQKITRLKKNEEDDLF
jgi:NAD(P)-dependent dehydrogenase (short-subunit alcohol dehydrogenase family)